MSFLHANICTDNAIVISQSTEEINEIPVRAHPPGNIRLGYRLSAIPKKYAEAIGYFRFLDLKPKAEQDPFGNLRLENRFSFEFRISKFFRHSSFGFRHCRSTENCEETALQTFPCGIFSSTRCLEIANRVSPAIS